MTRYLALILAQQSLMALPETVDFNDHIQPILSEYCYHCHGPDSSTREPKSNPLRLDREEFAFLKRDHGRPVIIKGKADASELVKRIISKDPDDVMPTPKSHKPPLNDEQVALLKKWITQGAEYEEHWSFTKPVRPELPKQKWGNNPIDAFIAKKHGELEITANDPAEMHRLIRRLTFDIIGVAPTPEEILEFEDMAAQDLATAVQLTAEKLMQRDQYAEHWGRYWLDAARYADTHGIHIDNYRAIWPYRDWVIEAFRKNMSFKNFTIDQIAGDLLPSPTLEQTIATGFSRCLPTTGEGGAISEEYEAIYAKERVETTSAIWLGLTTGCAACHDHKFDPISQKDFYAMSAFFRNTTMAAMDRNNADHPPNVFAPTYQDRPRWNALEKEITTQDSLISSRRDEAQPDFEAWAEIQGTNALEKIVVTSEVHLPLVIQDQKLTGIADSDEKEWTFPEDSKTELRESIGQVPSLSSVNLDLGDIAQFKAKDQVSFGGFLYIDSTTNGSIISRMDTGNNYRGWDLWLEGNKIGSHIIDQWPKSAIKAVTKKALTTKKWHHVMVTYDGKAKPHQSLQIFINGKVQKINYSHKEKLSSIDTKVPTRLGARHPNNRIKGTVLFHDFKLFRKKLSAQEINAAAEGTNINALLATPVAKRDEAQNKSIFDYFIKHFDSKTTALTEHKKNLIKEREMLRKNGSITLVMKEKKGAAYAHILDRGEYSLKKEQVFAAVPELFVKPSEEKKSRLDLANWLVSEENPLTARVTVNRIWYHLFGRGIVETTEDFGIMGARPTHPELLDWLAIEFMESGWDMQHIIKLITSSATYQLSDKVESAQREKDPTNLFLGRSSRFRLEAEQIRDHALASSGLLKKKIGGPSVKPYQPDGIWEAVAMNQSNTRYYKVNKKDGLYRRSLYTFWKRTAAPASMEILNAPTRETFCVRRDRTNTPLQAFVLLNDTQFLEAARHLAAQAIQSLQTFDHRLDFMTLKLIGRRLENDERAILKKTLQNLTKRYESDEALATELTKIGESPTPNSIPAPELATWTIIASQLFNLDENLTK